MGASTGPAPRSFSIKLTTCAIQPVMISYSIDSKLITGVLQMFH